jgi:hypothetical protein
VLEGFVTREGEIYLTVMEDMNLSSAASLKVTIHELMKFTAHLRNDYEEQSKSNE